MRFCHRTVTQPQFGLSYLLFLHNSLGKEVIFCLFLKVALFKALKSLSPVPFHDFEAEHFMSLSFYVIAFCYRVLLPSISKPCLQGSDAQWRSGHLTLKMRPTHGLETLGNETQWWNAVSQKNESLFLTILICPSFHSCLKFYSCILPWSVPLNRSPLGCRRRRHHHHHGRGLLKQMSSATCILGIHQPISTTQFPCIFLYPDSPPWFRSAASSSTSRVSP
jgi:hypothetical protein